MMIDVDKRRTMEFEVGSPVLVFQMYGEVPGTRDPRVAEVRQAKVDGDGDLRVLYKDNIEYARSFALIPKPGDKVKTTEAPGASFSVGKVGTVLDEEALRSLGLDRHALQLGRVNEDDTRVRLFVSYPRDNDGSPTTVYCSGWEPEGWEAPAATEKPSMSARVRTLGMVVPGDLAAMLDSFADDPVRVAQEYVRAFVGKTSAEERERAARRAHISDLEVIGRRLHKEAEDRDWCEEYGEILDEVGAEMSYMSYALMDAARVEREYTFVVEVPVTGVVQKRVTVTASSYDAAVEAVKDDPESYVDTDDIDTGSLSLDYTEISTEEG